MKKELVRNTDKKLLAGVVAGLQEAYAPRMNLTLLRVPLVLTALFIHPLTPVLLTAYALLWMLMPTPAQAMRLSR